MTNNTVAATYNTYFVSMDLERCAVFKAVQAWIGRATVLYPGCFIHIAPSYFFQHVVYVDRQPAAAQFFADQQSVLDYVSGRKQYQQAPYIRFIAQDYTTALPLRENSFDLLLSLYAGGISSACCAYLKPGGILLSNNHHDDAGQAARSGHYELVAVIHKKRDTCQISDTNLDGFFAPKQRGGQKARLQRQRTTPEYTRSADYYLFKKL